MAPVIALVRLHRDLFPGRERSSFAAVPDLIELTADYCCTSSICRNTLCITHLYGTTTLGQMNRRRFRCSRPLSTRAIIFNHSRYRLRDVLPKRAAVVNSSQPPLRLPPEATSTPFWMGIVQTTRQLVSCEYAKERLHRCGRHTQHLRTYDARRVKRYAKC